MLLDIKTGVKRIIVILLYKITDYVVWIEFKFNKLRKMLISKSRVAVSSLGTIYA